MLHRRYAPHVSRRAPRALPRAAAADDDRRGLALHRPDRLRPRRLRPQTDTARGQTPRTVRDATMLDIDVAGLATVTEGGIEIERAPEGVRFEPLDEEHPRLGALVGADEKFAAHNAAAVEARPARPTSRRASCSSSRCTCGSPTRSTGGSLFWRLLVVAEEGSQLHADRGVRRRRRRSSSGYSNAAVELFVEQGAKLEYVSLQNLSRETWHFASHHARVERDAELDWVAGRLRLEEGQGPDPERPRRPGRDLARHRRVLRRRRPAPRLRHLPGAHRAEHDVRLRLQGRAARRGDGGLARDDPRREGRAEDERVPGEPQPAAVADRRTRTRSRGSRSSPTTSAARTARRSARSTASSSST